MWHRQSRALVIGAVTAVLAAAAVGSLPGSFTKALHERTIDTLLALAAPLRPGSLVETGVVVLDIDTPSLAAIGPWPWPRRRIAALVEATRRSGAASVAIDILFEGADAKSP